MLLFLFSSIQSLSRVRLFATPWTAACQASLSITNSWSLLKLTSIELVMPSNHLSFFSSCLQSFQHQRIFQWVRSSHQVAKVLELQIQHQLFQWIFRTDLPYDWLVWSPCSPRDSQQSSPTPQFKSINSSVLSFFMVQLSHPYMTTGKAIVLIRWTFVGKVMSLLFNMLSRLFLAFLPRSKCLLIHVTICSHFGAQENKICQCFRCFPIYLPWSDGTGCHDLSFLNVEFHSLLFDSSLSLSSRGP